MKTSGKTEKNNLLKPKIMLDVQMSRGLVFTFSLPREAAHPCPR